MVTTVFAALFAVTWIGAGAIAQPNITVTTEEAKKDPQKKAQKKAQKSAGAKSTRVMCVPQTWGPHPVIKLHPTIITRWQLIDPALNYDLGNTIEYTDKLDKPQRKRLRIQPVSEASPTNLTIEGERPMAFRLETVKNAAEAVDLVIVRPVDPDTGKMVSDPRCNGNQDDRDDIERMEQVFKVYPAKTGHWESDGLALDVQLSKQYREGDTMKFRYSVDNEGRHYQIAEALIVPLGATEPLQSVTFAADRGQRFPVELPHGAQLSGSMHIKEGASLLENGFKLQLNPARAGLPAAVVGFEDPEPNEGRLTLQVQALGGAISLKNGADETDLTSMVGVGGRLVYGFTRALSFDVSVAVLSTQQAQFDDESTAEASSVRALAGGVLHFGDKIAPYFRAGLGVRVADYTVSTAADSELRIGGLFCVGGGIDAWLGEQFVMGLSAQFVGQGFADEEASVEVSAYAGIAWDR